MPDENVSKQFYHIIGASMLKEAQDSLEATRSHITQYTKPIYDATPDDKKDELWNHPLFGKITPSLDLASQALTNAQESNSKGDIGSAGIYLRDAHDHVRNAVNDDWNMRENYDSKYEPIADPNPLFSTRVKLYDSMVHWVNMLKDLGH